MDEMRVAEKVKMNDGEKEEETQSSAEFHGDSRL
jgi:hypothetical protein